MARFDSPTPKRSRSPVMFGRMTNRLAAEMGQGALYDNATPQRASEHMKRQIGKIERLAQELKQWGK
ncbi:hypothetical protein [Terrarubrum flagellatum]|uniref:hypothetical protein n=1 Tax=Terrirubrum flagellatum TaxID=2895980 RepID=UPI003145427A